MGIKKLTSYLREHAPKSFAGQPCKFETQVPVAIDVSLFLHKFAYAVGPQFVDSSFVKFRTNLLQSNMKPIWVFDGNNLDLKLDERVRRSNVKTSIEKRRLEQSDTYFVANEIIVSPYVDRKRIYDHLKTMLQSEDEVLVSKYEGEALCSYLVTQGKAFAAISSDSDLFGYLCPKIILDCSMGISNAKLIDMKEILEELQLSESQFQKFCILCGSDFMKNVPGIGPVAAFKHAKNGTFPEKIDMEKYETIKNLFATYCYESID